MKKKEVLNAYEKIYQEEKLGEEEQSYYALCLQLTNPAKNKRYLDVACGQGSALALGKKIGMYTVGIDFSARSVFLCKSKVPKCELVRSSAEFLPFREESFDCITCHGSLEHFIDPISSLKEMKRILKKNGRLVITIPNSFNWRKYVYGPRNFIKAIVGFIRVFFNYFRRVAPIPKQGIQPIDREFSLNEVGKIIHNGDLRILKIIGYDRPVGLSLYDNFIRWLIPLSLCHLFIIIAIRH